MIQYVLNDGGREFYVVWQPENGAPTVHHGSYQDAKHEATRLANANRGKKFFVLKAVGYMEFPQPQATWTTLDDGCPF
jgi:hypothetical protein